MKLSTKIILTATGQLALAGALLFAASVYYRSGDNGESVAASGLALVNIWFALVNLRILRRARALDLVR